MKQLEILPLLLKRLFFSSEWNFYIWKKTKQKKTKLNIEFWVVSTRCYKNPLYFNRNWSSLSDDEMISIFLKHTLCLWIDIEEPTFTEFVLTKKQNKTKLKQKRQQRNKESAKLRKAWSTKNLFLKKTLLEILCFSPFVN